MSELVRKQRTMHVLEEQLVLLSERSPVLVIFEDAHWADPTSVELMGRILRRVMGLRAMVIANFRPEFTPPWLGLGNVTLLTLNQLGRRQAIELIAKAAGGVTLPGSVVDQIVAKAQGIPLFVEEITRSVVGSGTLEERDGRYHLRDADAPFAIPATLQDSLVARLDRLGTAKDVALAASIIGQEFSFELVGTAASVEPTLLTAALEQLVHSDIVTQRGEPPQAVYTFKHALIRDAAYQTVLKSRKRHLHQRVAETLESRFPDLARTEPELLAHHYSEADVVDRALDYWRKAAEHASANLAHAEAIGHIGKAMALISAMPDGLARDEWELAFLTLPGRRTWPGGVEVRWRAPPMIELSFSLTVSAGWETSSGRSGVSGWAPTAPAGMCGPEVCWMRSTRCSKRRASRNTSCRHIMPPALRCMPRANFDALFIASTSAYQRTRSTLMATWR